MSYTRRRFLETIGTAAAGSVLSHYAFGQVGKKDSRPNIVFILTDDLGYGDLGCYGHPHIKTPYLDLLAKEGLQLTQCYAAAPLCSPARAAIMTGRTPFRCGIESWIPADSEVHLSREEITIASLLKAQGYATFMGGKWHLAGKFNSAEQPQPGDHGFDYWFATPNFTIPDHRNPGNFVRNGEPVGPMEGFAAEIVVDEAIGWLHERNPQQPFFQYICLHEPHSEIASPQPFLDMYAAFTSGQANSRVLTDRGPGEYFANVSHLDYQVGRLMKELDRLGLRDNTLVVFTSDNGPVTRDWRHWWEINMYGSSGSLRGRKDDLWESGIRVPGILRFPGRIQPRSVSHEPVHGYDFLPTVCKLAGAKVPDDRPLDGQDISPVFGLKPLARKQPLYWQFAGTGGAQYAIRDGDWKLIADREMKTLQLYNLKEDPAEKFNLAEKQSGRLDELVGIMKVLNDSVANDPLRSS